MSVRMSNPASFDIRLVNYIVRRLDKYVIWKKNKETDKLEKIWLKLFQNKDNFIHQLSEGLKIKLYKDSVLSRYIYDRFETSEIEFLIDFLREGDCFVDIGSNIGLYSLYASGRVGPNGLVIAFEPANQTYNRLLENIKLNGIKNIRPFRLGLSNKDEILELNISSNGFEAWNTFVQTKDVRFSLKEKVQVKSFDNFLVENMIDADKISLIKLDVEGFEINVLKGSDKLLAGENAPVFMVEFTDENAINAGNCCHELYKLLLPYGYSWYTYDPNNKKLNPESMRLNYPYNNLIAVKNAANNKRISSFSTEHF
jgi:FkbM family methyltransferase